MIRNKVIIGVDEIDFTMADIPFRKEPENVLLCNPEHFNVVGDENIYMKEIEEEVDQERAKEQWSHLLKQYKHLQHEGLLKKVKVLDAQPELYDMVFCANTSFPWMKEDGEKVVVMSNMRHDSRKKEVLYVEEFYKNKDYKIEHLPENIYFEAMGDAIPHPGKQLIWGGYGFRTSRLAYDHLTEILEVPIIALKLNDERFYHLDTCFLPADEDTVLICREAFDDGSLEMIHKVFKHVINIPVEEAVKFFALNAHCIFRKDIEKKVAIIEAGTYVTAEMLSHLGYEVYEVITSEFMKSGGSIFCMKMMYY